MSAGPRCVGTPIPWLRIEQHHAGDLGASESAAITANLATCGACASCLARIVQDDALALPALSVAPPAKVLALRRVAPVLAALAVAAVILFVLGRDDEGVIAEAGGVYRDGDRWKALVTCPAGMRAAWDLVVFEHGEAAFPLEPQPDLACGNAVAPRRRLPHDGARTDDGVRGVERRRARRPRRDARPHPGVAAARELQAAGSGAVRSIIG